MTTRQDLINSIRASLDEYERDTGDEAMCEEPDPIGELRALEELDALAVKLTCMVGGE